VLNRAVPPGDPGRRDRDHGRGRRPGPGVCRTISGGLRGGGHPSNNAAEAVAGDWERVTALATQPGSSRSARRGSTVTGTSPPSTGSGVVRPHLDLANRLDLPVVIHCRDCMSDMIDQLSQLRRRPRCPTLLHGDVGRGPDPPRPGPRPLVRRDDHVRQQGAGRLRAVAARVPLDRLLVETDSPYLSPHPHRGRTNEPCRVR
jgi:TatD DNase family protein